MVLHARITVHKRPVD